MSAQGKYAKAEEVERELHTVNARVLGPEHPSTLNSAYTLGQSLYHQRKFHEGQQLLEAVLAARHRVLGPAHPDTLRTIESLDIVRWKMDATRPTTKAGKAVARRKERAASAPPSPTALAEAQAKASVAEAELLAMLKLEEAGAMPAGKGKAKGKRNSCIVADLQFRPCVVGGPVTAPAFQLGSCRLCTGPADL